LKSGSPKSRASATPTIIWVTTYTAAEGGKDGNST
jgi:hypothetical protein